MPHFRDSTNSIHYLDQADIERGAVVNEGGEIIGNSVLALLPPDCVPITDTEAEQLRNPIEKVRDECWEAIKAERDRRTQQGGFQVGGHWFHSDTFSRTQQLGLVMLGTGMPAGVQWKTMSGAFVPMTPQLAQQIFEAAAAADIAVFAAAEAHRVAMLATPNPAEYDFSKGWPATFGEEA